MKNIALGGDVWVKFFKREQPNSKLGYSGERFTTGPMRIETEIEHYHRYFFARYLLSR